MHASWRRSKSTPHPLVGAETRLGRAAPAPPRLLRDAPTRGKNVSVWTLTDPVQMSVMISRGADGLITDEPALARQVIALREDMSALGRLVIWMAGETGLIQGLEEASPEGDA